MNDVKNRIKELSQNLQFNLNEQELLRIEEEYNDIVHSLDILKNTNVFSVVPTSFVQSQYLIDLDEIFEPIEYNQKEVFANCNTLINEMVIIKNEK